MSLNKQFYVYSMDTSSFYNEDELLIHEKMNGFHMIKNNLKLLIVKMEKKGIRTQHFKSMVEVYNNMIKKEKERLYEKLKENKGIVRKLRDVEINDKNIVSMFDSTLTRTLKMKQTEVNTEIFIVQTFFFDVLEDLIKQGFTYNDEKYIIFTASAGQLRSKKSVFIKESVYNQYANSLTCGVTLDKINSKGGMNVNKYFAYLALCNSATDEWVGFDITKSIVVDDFETLVNTTVDFIDDKTYKIERKTMDVPIPHMDGCGLCLKDRTGMGRLPFVKGLMVKMPYVKFIKKHKCSSIVKDIYGKEYDIIKDDIQYIFTKSQFKMYKYFDNWKEYTDNFIKYNCSAGKCNEEEHHFNNAKINYQMLQTLIDTTDEELIDISEKTNNDILKLYSDRVTMLKVLGVTKENTNKNYMQQALEIYPELLNDTYNKEILKQAKKSLVKNAKSGKLNIDGKYTFIIPDLYAFCEWLFLGEKNPKGMLNNGEVYCKLYEDKPKLDCLRSPHLDFAHAVRDNVANIKEKNKLISEWFVTNGLYTSVHDTISKTLQFDCDGDKALVCANETIINIAERVREKYDIVPLYYNMLKAPNQIIDCDIMYNGIVSAYTGGNIGIYSNNISKIWNDVRNDEKINNGEKINLDIIKILCMENNFIIDYAKTLYKPERPQHIKTEISKHIRSNLPHFFKYAKDKTEEQIEIVNNSVVNRLDRIIKNPTFRFSALNLGIFDYKLLMSDYNFEFDSDSQSIIDLYDKLNNSKNFIFRDRNIGEKEEGEIFVYNKIKEELFTTYPNKDLVLNTLIKYLYKIRNSSKKTTLWECFGDIIFFNLQTNIPTNTILCEQCGVRVVKKNNKTRYCNKCSLEILAEQKREWSKINKKPKISEK